MGASWWVVATGRIAVVRIVVGGSWLDNGRISVAWLGWRWLVKVHLKVIVSDVWLYRGLSLSKSYCILLTGLLLSFRLFITYNLFLLL